jgi:glycosyltransferase involved in cell wall biosynthesis
VVVDLSSGDLAPLPLEGERVLVLAFDTEVLGADLSAAERVLVVADEALDVDSPRVSFRELLQRGGSKVVREFSPTACVLHTMRGASPLPLLAAIRAGARRCVIVDAPGAWFQTDPRIALALCSIRRARRILARLPGSELVAGLARERLDPPWPALADTLRLADSISARARSVRLAPPAEGPLRIVHYLGTLTHGGAERQLTYLARASRERGHQVAVWVAHSLEGDAGHYVPALRKAGVEVRQLPRWRRTRTWPQHLADLPFAAQLPRHLAIESLLPLTEALLSERPDVLHCWLDETNLVGGLAGLLTDVPRVVLSARNVSPLRIPRLRQPWYRATYRALSRCERVTCIANSAAGAADYALWTEAPPTRWRVVLNGFDASACLPPSDDDRAAGRAALGVPPDAFLVVGVFRIEVEKRPHEFLDVLSRVRAEVPGMRALHVGNGPLAERTHDLARERGLGEALTFLGRRDDPWAVLGLADASLLTSEVEGLPNVSLESQALGVPVVLTEAGGAPESIDPGRTGFACPIGDTQGLAERLIELWRNPEQRRTIAAAGPSWIADRFGLQRMVQETLELYV